MRAMTVAILFAGAAAGLAQAPQQPQFSAPLDESVTVYKAGKDVTAPELLSSSLHVDPIRPCVNKESDAVSLDFVVDGNGMPRNAVFHKALGTELDGLALKVLHSDRFKPGMRAGVPVPVAQTATVQMTVCEVQWPAATGTTVAVLKLGSLPVQTFAGRDPNSFAQPVAKEHTKNGFTAPYALVTPMPYFVEEAARLNLSGDCLVSLIVNAEGMPADLKLLQGLGHGLNESAMDAVERYRFLPAMHNGQPTPVRLNVQVRFRFSGPSALPKMPPRPKMNWEE